MVTDVCARVYGGVNDQKFGTTISPPVGNNPKST